MKRLLIIASLCAAVSASGYGHHNSPHHHGHHAASHHHHHHHGHNQQSGRPRYYDVSPQIIASPKPKTLNPYAQQAHYGSQVSPVQFVARQSRQESAQLIASASNTPVLVLKKEHSRPVLSSAVAASSTKVEHEEKHEQQQKGGSEQKPLPTIVMRNPSEQKQSAVQPQPQVQKPQPPKPISVEEDVISEEEHEPNVSNASAERRMFFQNVAANSAPAPKIHDEDEEEERAERIVRSNSNNPYGGGQIPFEYPPQSNYISAGPTRTPVKYQQGVVGIKPQGQSHDGRGRPQQRPYKQRIQQAQREGQQGQGGLSEEPLTSEELAEAEEDAKPDRLTELLLDSKFSCQEKKDGYYADDSLKCEVFHYCQDGGKHSWLCPNGFAFHQIHLICVPPSSDDICKQSTNYHFVNDYLYRPVNEKQASMTNESLKYADRYFPDGYNHGAGDVILPYEDEEDEQQRHPQQQQQHHARPQPQRENHHQAFLQAQQQAHLQQQPQRHPQQQHHARPQPQRENPQQQRPRVSVHPSAYNSNPYNQQPSPRPSGIQHGFVPSPTPSGLHGHYAQQRSSGSSISPTILPQQPVSKSQQGPPQSQSSLKPQPHGSSSQNPGAVFFSPESINIPLNQRRPIPNPHPSHHPQIFRPSPQVHRSGSSNRKNSYDEEEEY